jgi:hypothetical protein
MRGHKWSRLFTGLVNQQLLLRNEYLIAGNRILRSHLPDRYRLTDPQRSTLAEIAKRLGRKALAEVAIVVGGMAESREPNPKPAASAVRNSRRSIGRDSNRAESRARTTSFRDS